MSSKEHIVFCLVAGEVKWNGKKHPGCHQIHLLAEQHHTCPAGLLGRANLSLKCFPNFSWFFSFSRQLGFHLEPVWQCLASCQGLWRLMTWKMRNVGRKTLKLWEKGSLEPASCEEDCDLFLDGVWRGKGSGSSFRATALYLTCVSLKSDSPSHEGSGVPRVQQVLSFPS